MVFSLFCMSFSGVVMVLDFQKNAAISHHYTYHEGTSAQREIPVIAKKTLYYQPIVDVSRSQVVFYEALLRFVAQDGSVFSPASFVQRAEADGSIIGLDTDSLSMAFGILGDNPSLTLSINVSCLSLEDPLWFLRFTHLAKAHPDALSRFMVEVTETRNFSLSQQASHRLRDIHAMGVRLALDDADHVPFACVQACLEGGVPVDFLKISRHLTSTWQNGAPPHQGLALLSLAEDYGLMVIMEGVETKPQSDALCAQGLFLQQGYHWGQPAGTLGSLLPF